MSVNDHGGREPPTNYIKQMNAFLAQSAGVLGAKEQAVYLRLFRIWNSLKRPEWFAVSIKQLMHDAGIKRRNTVISAKTELAKKGFILIRQESRTSITKFKLIDLTNKYQNDTKTSINMIPDKYQNDTKTSINMIHIIKDIKDKDISTTTTADMGGKSQAVEFYQNNIRPICSGYELERLEDDISHYGEDTVIKAIHRAVTRNKRSIGYVEGILRRWETDGFDEEGEHGRGTRSRTGTHQRKAPRKDGTDWDDPNADFGGW